MSPFLNGLSPKRSAGYKSSFTDKNVPNLTKQTFQIVSRGESARETHGAPFLRGRGGENQKKGRLITMSYGHTIR